jgi:hypothetical protein
LTGCREEPPEEHFYFGRLSGSIWTDKTEYFSLLDLETDSINSNDAVSESASVDLREILHHYGIRHARTSCLIF